MVIVWFYNNIRIWFVNLEGKISWYILGWNFVVCLLWYVLNVFLKLFDIGS